STLRDRQPVAVRDIVHAGSGLVGLVTGRALTIGRCPVKALAISLVAGAALCSVMSAPAATMPISNLAVAASDLALGQSVRYRHRYRLRSYYSGPYYGYGAYGYGGGAAVRDALPPARPH